MSKLLSGRDFASQGGGWVVIQSVLMLTTFLLAVMYPGRWINLPMMISGGILFILGAGFGIAGVLGLGRNRTPFPRPRAGSQLIQHGICRQDATSPLYQRHAGLGKLSLNLAKCARVWGQPDLAPVFSRQSPPGRGVAPPNLFGLCSVCPARAAVFAAVRTRDERMNLDCNF